MGTFTIEAVNRDAELHGERIKEIFAKRPPKANEIMVIHPVYGIRFAPTAFIVRNLREDGDDECADQITANSKKPDMQLALILCDDGVVHVAIVPKPKVGPNWQSTFNPYGNFGGGKTNGGKVN